MRRARIRSADAGLQLTLALTQDEVQINGASLAGPSLADVVNGLDHVAPFAFTAAAWAAGCCSSACSRCLCGRPPATGRACREKWL